LASLAWSAVQLFCCLLLVASPHSFPFAVAWLFPLLRGFFVLDVGLTGTGKVLPHCLSYPSSPFVFLFSSPLILRLPWRGGICYFLCAPPFEFGEGGLFSCVAGFVGRFFGGSCVVSVRYGFVAVSFQAGKDSLVGFSESPEVRRFRHFLWMMERRVFPTSFFTGSLLLVLKFLTWRLWFETNSKLGGHPPVRTGAEIFFFPPFGVSSPPNRFVFFFVFDGFIGLPSFFSSTKGFWQFFPQLWLVPAGIPSPAFFVSFFSFFAGVLWFPFRRIKPKNLLRVFHSPFPGGE